MFGLSVNALILISLLLFSVIGIAITTYYLLTDNRRHSPINRLRPYVDSDYRKKIAKQEMSESQEEETLYYFSWLVNLVSQTVTEDLEQDVRDWLLEAGLRVHPSEFLVVTLLFGVIFSFAGATLAYLIGNLFLVFSILAGSIGLVLPLLYVPYVRRKRQNKFNEQLVNVITLLSNSIKSGYGFTQALRLVVDEVESPASDEFQRVIRENRLGVPLAKALKNLVERMNSENLDLAVTAIIIQRDVGGSMTDVLDSIANTIRERQQLQGKIKALTAQGRMGGIIISSLPFLIGGAFSILRYEMMYNFVTHPIGIAMIAGAIFMQALGVFFVWQVVNIDVAAP